MKKRFLLVLVVLMWALPGLAQAANVSVYLEGKRVATAVQREGDYFVPLRTMLELCGYQANWNEEAQCVWSVLDNSEFFYVREGREGYCIERIDPDEPEEIRLLGGMQVSHSDNGKAGLVAFMLNGQMYIDYNSVANVLRLDRELAEDSQGIYFASHEAHSDYTDPEIGGEFDLNLFTGQLMLNGQELAVLDLPYYERGWYYRPIWLERTPGGNYVLHYSYDGWNVKNGILRATYFINTACQSVQKVSAMDYPVSGRYVSYYRLPKVFQTAGAVWLSGDEGIWRLEDKQGADAKAELLQLLPKLQALGLPLQHAYCYWTDGRYMLLGDLQRFAFYDMQENKGLDLTPLLLSDGSADLINQCLITSAPQFYTEAGLAEFWQRLNQLPTSEQYVSQPGLRFENCTEGVLYFELSFISYANTPHSNRGSYTVSLGLQPLKELL